MPKQLALTTAPPDSPVGRWRTLFTRMGYKVQGLDVPAGVIFAATLCHADFPDDPLTVLSCTTQPEVDGRPSLEGLSRNAAAFVLSQPGAVAWLPAQPSQCGLLMRFPSRLGTRGQLYPIVGWAQDGDFRRGPVVDTITAPAPSIRLCDALLWFQRVTAGGGR